MDLVDSLLLLGVGIVASIINTLAGGGSLITVPALVLVGAPGTVANGTNRVGILTGTLNAARTFSKHGVKGMEGATRILIPAVLGSVVGSTVVSQIADDTFEQAYASVFVRAFAESETSGTALGGGYEVAFNLWENAINVFGGDCGQPDARFKIDGGHINLTAGVPYSVGLDVYDTNLRVYVDGVQYGEYNMSSKVCRSGSIGFRTFYSDMFAHNLTVANRSAVIENSAAWGALSRARRR